MMFGFDTISVTVSFQSLGPSAAACERVKVARRAKNILVGCTMALSLEARK